MRWRVPQPGGAGRWDGGVTEVPVTSPGSAASHGTGPSKVSLRIAQNGSGPPAQWMCPASAASTAGGAESGGVGIFSFWTRCWVGLCSAASGCAQIGLAQREVQRNMHIPSAQSHQEQSGFILAALLHTVGSNIHWRWAFYTSALQLEFP